MPHDALIDRFLHRGRNILLARGRFTDLFADYWEHSGRWVGEPDGLVSVMMSQGLAAAALYLTTRPPDEETAWTINLPEPPLNLFFVADASRGRVVGRFYDRHVRSEANSRLFVQRVRGADTPYESVIEVRGFDVLDMLESYYAQSEQSSARFFEDERAENGERDVFFMVMALPGIDEAWLRGLDLDRARDLFHDPGTAFIERRAVIFSCACDESRLMELAVSIFSRRPEELFGEDGWAEIFCPRCGRAYEIEREAFDRFVAEKQEERAPEEGDAGDAGDESR
ncbi:MAG: Hsp33 family molecular chaperone HslO [Candidatus Eisenbacteria bacterium]|nr:Hsp33 family molecular chaperone HslO [Candidatus Eisenbacteria bacterium]